MDAKPYRPLRALPSQVDENKVPLANKTIHQRHKSTGNLLNMSSTGNLKVAAKRNGITDLSTASKPAAARDGPMAATKNTGTSTITIFKDQENRSHVNSKEAFLRPAQRPPSKSIVTSASMSHIRSVANESQAQPINKQGGYNKPTKRASIAVYNDGQSDKDKKATNMVDAKPDTRQRTFNKPHRASSVIHNESKPQNGERWRTSEVPKESLHFIAEEYKQAELEPYDRLYEYLKENPKRYPGSRLSDGSRNVPDQGLKPAARYRYEDEVTEAPYLDAVEEVPKEDHYPVQAPIEEPSMPAPPLSERITASVPNPKVDVKIANQQSHRISAPIHEHAEISDYEDDDYYDDQGYTTAHSYRSRGDNTTGGATTIMFPPKLSKKGVAELEVARGIVESKRAIDDSQDDEWDISMVAEYGDEIFQYMKELEATLLPNPHYMDIQTEIQWSMRAILMDWVIQVHTRFGLLPETLFLTVNFIDRFLSYKIVSLGKLQLVGATAIFVAAKYEEINCPSVQEIVYMVDSGYTVDEILKAERFMLSMLNFELGWPGPMSFLRRISKADDYDIEIRTLAKYFLEVTIMDERFVASPPSYVAAGAHCLSRMILGKGDWTPEHVHYSCYTYTQLKPLIGMMLDCCRIGRKHHAAVFEKYADKRFKRASLYVEGEIAKGFSLPFQRSLHCPIPGDLFEDELLPLPWSEPELKMPIPT
ncbi:cyclin-like protein [Xylariaceae sp. FL0662B]|nr:cyclin-like protein [Xylariaceae sp. FL0662B]